VVVAVAALLGYELAPRIKDIKDQTLYKIDRQQRYVRAAHKQGWFEVIAGKSVVAFRREDEGELSSAKCFGFVQTNDENPRRRLCELMKSQGMQENQQVVLMSDGGENVRSVQEYLHPFSEHLIVPHHDAADGSPTADEGLTARATTDWR
jgi:hypothetical protein